MSRVLLATLGSTGDVLPYLGLARALLDRGHRVQAASAALHEPLFRGVGVDFYPSSQHFTVERFNALLDSLGGDLEPIRHFERLVLELLLVDAEAQLAAHLPRVAEADLVVAHRFDYVAQEAAIRAQKPWFSVSLMPEVHPTEEAPPFPFMRLGRWFARLMWQQTSERAQPMNQQITTRLAALGAAPRPLGICGAEGELDLLAVSPVLVEARQDWPAAVRLTGAWRAPRVGWEPPGALAQFLRQHPRPVVVSFGSMGGGASAHLADVVEEALQRTGRAAIIQRGYAELSTLPSAQVLHLGFAPHEWLFPQAGLVIHHAGAGTALSAARAGVPSVVVPHLFDQYYWAGVLHRLGVATRPVFARMLGGAELAELIREASTPPLQEAARALAARLAEERGEEQAATLISDELTRRGL